MLLALVLSAKAQTPKHEVRAVWLTTIGGIDWQHGGNDVVTEDDGNPHNGIACY